MTVEQLRKRSHVLRSEGLSLAVVPRALPREMAEDFAWLAGELHHVGDLLLVVDEVGYFGRHCTDWLELVATQSRHMLMPVVLVAQRSTQVPKTARTQASHFISYRQENAADLAALADDYGDTFPDGVPRLARGEWKHWRDSAAEPPRKERKQ